MREGPKVPRWFTPGRLLLLFCCMNLLVYIDRGTIASNGVNGKRAEVGSPGYGIMDNFSLSLFQDGFLPSAFMVGLLVSSPAFAEASKYFNAFRLIAVGLGVWTAAAVGCALATGFWMLLACRMLGGIGEASFVALAAPFIDDAAPPSAKSRWLAAFYLCIPTGYALGYIAGGALAGPLGWRAVFALEAVAMAPFVAFCAFAPPLGLRGGAGGKPGGSVGGELGDEAPHAASAPAGARVRAALAGIPCDLRELWRHKVFVAAVAGTTFYTGVFGVFSFQGPKAGLAVFGTDPETVDLTFGATTVATGVLGTLAGGLVLDRLGATSANALRICAAACVAGCALVVLAFAAPRTLAAFVPPFALGELALFMVQAPSNAVALWAVPPGLRPFAMSITVICIHVAGDVPAAPALGWLQDHVFRNWRLAMSATSLFLLAAAGAYAAGAALARTRPDHAPAAAGDSPGPAGAASESSAALQPCDAEAPLLQGGTPNGRALEP